MRLLTKKQMLFAVVCILLFSTLSVSTQAASKKTYWLSGVSKAAGGTLQMYYKNKTSIILKGGVKKYFSSDNLPDAKEKKVSYTRKIDDSCKVLLIEADQVETMTYAEWAAGLDYKNGDEISFIGTEIKVKNKKIVQISFSA